MKRSPFEVTDPELIKKPTLRRPKPNTPILHVKKGTKELDAQVAAMQARLAALKAEAAAAARQTDEIKRRTEEVSAFETHNTRNNHHYPPSRRVSRSSLSSCRFSRNAPTNEKQPSPRCLTDSDNT